MSLLKRLAIAIMALLSILCMGTVGFHYLEGWSFAESLYATVVTLSTVGYGDFIPHSGEGMMFTVFLIIVGVGTMLYTVGLITETMIEGRLNIILGKGRLEKMIKKMQDHYIICGCGRIGRLICRELAEEKVDFVVIDNDQEVIQRIEEEGYLHYKGDATQDKTLLAAGIKKAKGIICVLPSDAENLYVILTARELNQDIFILSRAGDEESEKRLLRAGANRVESPYMMGGMRMAMAILRPAMLDFVELTTMKQSLELRMDEIAICDSSSYIGKSLEDSQIRQKFGLIVVAVKKESGKMIFNPMAKYVLESNDKLIVLGEVENINLFTNTCLL
ncbi:MAG: potassium channel protein [Deltaproteobacteria bacterium]|nr:potassium channel protein [Deltaproteobacteria bacterium]